MKNLKQLICFILLAITFASCDTQRNTREVYYPPNDGYGEPMVNVHHRNSNGSYTDYFMAMALYNQLHASGGVENVHRYYQTHPESFRNNAQYKTKYSTVDRRPSTKRLLEARRIRTEKMKVIREKKATPKPSFGSRATSFGSSSSSSPRRSSSSSSRSSSSRSSSSSRRR
jgi:hypothetical protein